MIRVKLLGLLAFALVFSIFCGTAIAADTIKIGVLAPLTGFAAYDGNKVKNSVIMAADKLNDEGGLLCKNV